MFRALTLGGAFSGLLVPLVVLAASVTVGSRPVSNTSASSVPLNSQTVPLLHPANNIDPNPPTGGGDISIVSGSALLAQAGPQGSAVNNLDEHAGSSQISVYTVHPGDTLSGIAAMFDVSVNTIMWANGIKGGVIREGQTLVILPITGVRYTVAKGDTLKSVAAKYKADESDVAHYNDISTDASLAVGDTIIIPDGEMPTIPKKISPSKSKSTAPLRGTGGPLLADYYGWPLDGGVITQGLHGYDAVDIGAPSGTDVYAAAAGTVIIALQGGWNGGYGSYIVIQHDNGTQTLYSHESKVLVSPGDQVSKGDLIGKVGSTGKSTGPHVHFEVRGAANPFGA